MFTHQSGAVKLFSPIDLCDYGLRGRRGGPGRLSVV